MRFDPAVAAPGREARLLVGPAPKPISRRAIALTAAVAVHVLLAWALTRAVPAADAVRAAPAGAVPRAVAITVQLTGPIDRGPPPPRATPANPTPPDRSPPRRNQDRDQDARPASAGVTAAAPPDTAAAQDGAPPAGLPSTGDAATATTTPQAPADATPLNLTLPRTPEAGGRGRNPAVEAQLGRRGTEPDPRVRAWTGGGWREERGDADTRLFRRGDRCIRLQRPRADSLPGVDRSTAPMAWITAGEEPC
jgi:hypothetical protein